MSLASSSTTGSTGVSTTGPADTRSVDLVIGGMTCAACAARVERKLNKLDGVTATVNYATEKATVHLPLGMPVADVVTRVEQTGYTAHPVVPAKPDDGSASDADRVRMLWRRLVVALLLGAPAGDLSLTLALVPSLRFPGWQWLLLAMTLPVVAWCALCPSP